MTRARTLADSATGKSVKRDIFTSSGTWTCPTGVTVIDVLAVGGGGGGGASKSTDNTYSCVGGGGGGGQVFETQLTVTPGTSYTVTIGSGGLGSTSGASAGGVGGSTTFANGATVLLTALGGGGGASANYTTGVTYATASCFNGGGEASATTQVSRSQIAGSGGGSGNYTHGIRENEFSYVNGGVYNNVGTYGIAVDTVDLDNPLSALTLYSGSRPGIRGFGGSGAGSLAFNGTNESTVVWEQNSIGIDGGASGVKSTTSTPAVNGANATANTGGGGSGGATTKTTTLANGGNGGSGRLEIGYVA